MKLCITLFTIISSLTMNYSKADWNDYIKEQKKLGLKADQYDYVGTYLRKKWDTEDANGKKNALKEAIRLYVCAGHNKKPHPDISKYVRQKPISAGYFHEKEQKVLQFFSLAGLLYKDKWQDVYQIIIDIWNDSIKSGKAYDLKEPMKDKMMRHMGILLEAVSLGRFMVEKPIALHQLNDAFNHDIAKVWEDKGNLIRFGTQDAAFHSISQDLKSSWFKESLDLIKFLDDPSIPDKVKEYADKGISNFKTKEELKNNRLQAEKDHAPFGGRSGKFEVKWIENEGNWIKKIFDKTEDQIKKDLSEEIAPKPYSVGVIKTVYNAITSEENKEASINVVQGFGASYIPNLDDPGFLQVASQFDYRESVGAFRTDVLYYVTDYTQGPQASVEAAAAALHRAASEKKGTLPNALHKALPECTYYKHGYLAPHEATDSALGEDLNILEKNIDELYVLPQWVVYEATGGQGMQVFSAAPSYQGAKMPGPNTNGAKLCAILVDAQYEAIAKLSVIQSILQKKKVPLHLTLVGQSAFNNPPSVMKSSLEKVLRSTAGKNVEVFVHAYADTDLNKTDTALKAIKDMNMIRTNLSRDEFIEQYAKTLWDNSPTKEILEIIKPFEENPSLLIESLKKQEKFPSALLNNLKANHPDPLIYKASLATLFNKILDKVDITIGNEEYAAFETLTKVSNFIRYPNYIDNIKKKFSELGINEKEAQTTDLDELIENALKGKNINETLNPNALQQIIYLGKYFGDGKPDQYKIKKVFVQKGKMQTAEEEYDVKLFDMIGKDKKTFAVTPYYVLYRMLAQADKKESSENNHSYLRKELSKIFNEETPEGQQTYRDYLLNSIKPNTIVSILKDLCLKHENKAVQEFVLKNLKTS